MAPSPHRDSLLPGIGYPSNPSKVRLSFIRIYCSVLNLMDSPIPRSMMLTKPPYLLENFVPLHYRAGDNSTHDIKLRENHSGKEDHQNTCMAWDRNCSEA